MKPIYIVLIALAGIIIGFLIGKATSKNKSLQTTTTTTTTTPKVEVPATSVQTTDTTGTKS